MHFCVYPKAAFVLLGFNINAHDSYVLQYYLDYTHLCIFSLMFISRVCVCVLGKEAAPRFHSQSGNISSGRPQSPPPRGRLPTVGTSRDDCSRWGDCTCALAHTQTRSHRQYAQTCMKIHIHISKRHTVTITHTSTHRSLLEKCICTSTHAPGLQV